MEIPKKSPYEEKTCVVSSNVWKRIMGSIGVESNQDPQGEQTEKKQLKVVGFASKNTHA